MGALAYRPQIGLLTGWVHHAVYLCITEIAIRAAWAHIFCLCAVMEVCLRLLQSPPLFLFACPLFCLAVLWLIYYYFRLLAPSLSLFFDPNLYRINSN